VAEEHESRIRAVARLAEPLRRRLYANVAGRDEPTSRDEAAETAGIGRSLAAYHLDKLVEDGLLQASYKRVSGRTGPGAGRTAKLYRRSSREFVVTVPARDYELAASLLADAIEHDPTGAVNETLNDRARQAGRKTASHHRHSDPEHGTGDVSERRLLEAAGYEPYLDTTGTIRMRNCPFHRLVTNHRDLVCNMNRALIQGILDGIHSNNLATLDPRPDHCCVAIPPTRPEPALTE
jgi:predicted ArsR family transcriptional regulator